MSSKKKRRPKTITAVEACVLEGDEISKLRAELICVSAERESRKAELHLSTEKTSTATHSMRKNIENRYKKYSDKMVVLQDRLFVATLICANNGKCYICGCDLSEAEANKDHVFPKSQGYTLYMNMMPAHYQCNSDKGNENPSLDQINAACLAYETVGLIFDPRGPAIKSVKPFEAYLHNLKLAA